MDTKDIHKIADHWYETSVVPCRHSMMQDIEAWYDTKDKRLREVMTLAFFYGYSQALEDIDNQQQKII